MDIKAKQERKRAYQEQPKPAGVFQVKNTVNGKVLLGSSLNLHGPLNAHRFMLKMGGHTNKVLQQEWHTYGADAFIFEVLAEVQVTDNPHFHLSDELTLLEEIWLEELQPFGDRGYNTNRRIRQA